MKKSSLAMILALVGMVGLGQTSATRNAGCPAGYKPGILRDGGGNAYFCMKLHKPAVNKVKPIKAAAPVAMTGAERWSDWPPDQTPPIPGKAAPSVAPPKPDAPVLSFDPITFATTSTFPPIHAQATESTDDKGYHYVIDSPDKSFKCYVISTLEENPRNTYDHDIAAFTVACVKSVEKAK